MSRELFNFQYHCCQKLKINWEQNHQISQSHWNCLYCYCYCCYYYYYLISFRRIKAIQQIKICVGFEWTCINYVVVCISDWLIARNIAACSAGMEFKLMIPVHKNCLCLYNFHRGILKHLISWSAWVKNCRHHRARILTVLRNLGSQMKRGSYQAPGVISSTRDQVGEDPVQCTEKVFDQAKLRAAQPPKGRRWASVPLLCFPLGAKGTERMGRDLKRPSAGPPVVSHSMVLPAASLGSLLGIVVLGLALALFCRPEGQNARNIRNFQPYLLIIVTDWSHPLHPRPPNNTAALWPALRS